MTSAAAPWASVVIVAYNSGQLLQQCLDALALQTMGEYEALIVDNASTDGSIETLRLPDPRFRLVPSGANLGFAAGSNRGIRMSCAPWIATLNPDAMPTPGWLAAMRQATLRHPRVA